MDSEQKPVPNDTTPMPAMDADRINHANLAPQGRMNPEEKDDSKYTPEGDHEQVPNIPPSATDPD
ncbi:MAG: hypothetical protein ACRYF4_13760 [Janthinobacterium lividum]